MNLTASSLTCRHPGRTLGPYTLDWGPGLHVLHGRNGAGKTTLLRMLAGDLAPSAGTATLDGADLRRHSRARARVGFLRMDPELPSFLRVEEAWRMMASLRGRPDWDGRAATDALGLPGSLRLGDCSTGQRRKAELVAAMAGDPDVLLLDEPFAALDAAAITTLGAWLDAWRARIVLVATHDEMPVTPDDVVTL